MNRHLPDVDTRKQERGSGCDLRQRVRGWWETTYPDITTGARVAVTESVGVSATTSLLAWQETRQIAGPRSISSDKDRNGFTEKDGDAPMVSGRLMLFAVSDV
jgi:hypothetical protein